MTKELKLLIFSFMAVVVMSTVAMAAPVYSQNSTNSTLAGQPTLFSLGWNDTTGLGGYIFFTNNSGSWVNDSFVSFGSSRPWNTWDASEGVLLESFDNFTEWTKESDSLIFNDTTRFVEGSSSIGIWTGFQYNNTAIKKAINLNLSNATNFYFWFYTSDTYDLDHGDNPAISLYFTSDTNYLKSFSCSVFGAELKTGWNKIVIDKKNCYQDTGISESWENNMTSMQFRIYVKETATNTSVSIDNLRYDYAGGTHGKAVVIMTFDDGWNSTMTAYQIMKINGQRGASFVNPEPIIGEWEEYMSAENLMTLYNNGWDISSHSMTHYNLSNSSLTYDDLVYEINESKNWLDAQNFTRSSGFFAYPYHMYNDTVLSLVNKTYKMARNDFGAESQPHIYLDDPDNIPFLVKGTEILDTTTVDDINWVIERAIAQKSLLVLSFHKIVENASEETEWSIDNFQNVSDYIKTKVEYGWLDVMTFSEYYSMLSTNSLKSGWSNVTKMLNGTDNVSVGWCVYAKDTANSWNSDSCDNPFIITTETVSNKPFWSDKQSLVANTYDSTLPSEFNITWNSSVGIDSVLITITNSTDVLINNASMTNTTYGGAIYNYSLVLPAGTFNWTSYANDTSGNWGAADTWTFTIGQAVNSVYLYLNGSVNQNVTYTYPEALNVTATSAFGTAYLYRDGVQVENATEQILLGNGTYAYKVNATGNANYSDNADGVTFYAMVNKGILGLSISFDPSNTVTLMSLTKALIVENNVGDDGVVYELRRDGSLIENGTSESLTLGTYNYTLNATGNDNWTANYPGVWSLLNVQPPTNPLPSGGGGGGGGYVPPVTTTADKEDVDTVETSTEDSLILTEETEEPCVEDWICSGWSDCREGSQIRTCVDANDCGTEIDNSMEFMECDEQSQATGLFTIFTTPIGLAVSAMLVMTVAFVSFRTIRKKKQIKISKKKK